MRGAAERAEDFSRDLHEQTVEDLVQTASDFTRRQPALVFGLASLAGFLAPIAMTAIHFCLAQPRSQSQPLLELPSSGGHTKIANRPTFLRGAGRLHLG